MRTHGVLIAALLCAVVAPVAAYAQEPVSIRVMNRGMLGIMTEAMPANDPNARERLIVDVVSESAAERAGLLRGDIIVTVNGQPATQARMNAGFEPGDTVQLRIRRDGSVRQVQVIAGERPGGLSFYAPAVLSDSVRERVSIIMNDVRAHADTLAVHLRRFAADSASWTFGFGDSTNVHRFRGPDSAVVFHRSIEFDRAHIDSVRAHVYRMSEDLPRFLADSMRFRMEHFPDSAFFHVRPGGATSYRIRGGPDSTFVWQPAEVWASSFSFGARAVAGAELTELNDGLAAYFGTDSGVLVLNAAEGTPAERAGIRSGDVIVRANGIDVNSIMELRRAVEAAARGNDVELRVLRRGQNVDVRLRRE